MIWEYSVVRLGHQLSSSDAQEVLNKFGKLGWELVSVGVDTTYTSAPTSHVAYLKRRFRPSPPNSEDAG